MPAEKDQARPIQVVPYDPMWPARFRAEALRLRSLLGDNAVAFHHIGSTAIPEIMAKPIIDLLVEVRDLGEVDALDEKMKRHGYLPKGEFGIPGRRYFRKGTEAHHTHHVHIFQTGDPHIERQILFRDYLRAHPDEAQAYSQLKESLAIKFQEDPEGYMDGKDDFIKKIEEKAKLWKKENASPSRQKLRAPRQDSR
jgi:GrpB-like predicted nucleotidyltransferase (UPF0157 family)